MKGGWITLPRRFFDGPAWRENRKLSRAEAMLDLYQRAQWDAGEVFIRGKLLPLARGEQVASCRFLAERWGWTKDTVARFLKTMESESPGNRSNSATANSLSIFSEMRQGETVLSLCNYEEWTLAGMVGCDSDEPGSATQLETPTRTAARQGRDKAKEGEEDKESKNQNEEAGGELFSADGSIPKPPAKADPFESALAEIRESWPANAMTRFRNAEVHKALRKLGKAGLPPAGTFQRSLEAWKACGDWIKDGGQFVKSAHLWISSGMWENPPVKAEGGGLTDEERHRRVGGRWAPLTEDELAAQLGPRGATGEFGY